MNIKLRQFVHRTHYTNHLPSCRSRQFLLNRLAHLRRQRPSAPLRASIGLLLWLLASERIAYRDACFLTGRRRGMVRHFAISRTRIKVTAGEGRFFGLRKSS